MVRDVLQLFSSRGGRLTVFSQRSPRAVRSILGSVRLAAPALVCGGTMAYHYADGNRVPLCSFAQQQELLPACRIPPGVGVAVQMQDGTTRVLRMSNALERHLRQEWTPYLLANAADIHPDQVLRVLLYQDSKSVPLISLAEKAIGDRVALLGERIAPDTLSSPPSGSPDGKCWTPSAPWRRWVQSRFWRWRGGQPMAGTGAGCGAQRSGRRCPGRTAPCRRAGHPDGCRRWRCVEVLYRMVRAAEKSV